MAELAESKKLPRAPLILVLAQIKFPPVLRMDKYVPDIQESLRREGFTDYRPGQALTIIVGEGRTDRANWWEFGCSDKRSQIVLSRDSVSLMTTGYSTFEDFLTRLGQMVRPIEGHVGISSAHQLGLRYVDLLAEIDDLKTEDLLAPGFRGLPAGSIDPDIKETATSFVVQARTPHGVLTVRSVQVLGAGNQVIPPDLTPAPPMPFPLKFPDWVLSARHPRVLDFDHVAADIENLSFLPEILAAKFRDLRHHTRLAFHAVSTDEARAAWGRDEPQKEEKP